jgi:diguanylate cyclase (GGDEF)-like protein
LEATSNTPNTLPSGETAPSVAGVARPSAAPREPLRVLIIEDSSAYATLVAEMLADGLRGAVETVHCSELGTACEVLLGRPTDVVLLDLSLPDAHKLEALQAVQAAAPDVPVVVLTGADDPALGLEAVQAGAQDFLPKRGAQGEVLTRSIRYSIERKRAEVRLAEQALRDSLTGLPNRVLLLDRLNVALARARRRPTSVAILFLDLDRFKTINDSLGHEAGDQLLLELGERLRASLRPGDTVARFGGDEFLVLCEELGGEVEAVRVAERALRAIRAPMVVCGRAMSVGASVGIAIGSHAGAGAHDLIRQADAAMYRAKRRRSGIELYEAAMHSEAMNELEIEHQLRGAIERGELELRFQPQVSLVEGGRIVGAEVLIRWRHPQRGLLGPAEFIPLAEETGFIVEVGAWVLDEACRQLAAWRAAGVVPDDFSLSVNLSVRQLGRADLPHTIAAALARWTIPAERLCLEVTESCMAQDPERATLALHELKGLGVLLALDDFGTGYSSLSALSTYPLDVVKIDRSFIRRVGEDRAAARMFAAVLGVARAAELQAVAEGVEHPPQLRLLRRLGCEFGQGFIFARPVAADEFAGIVRDPPAAGLRHAGPVAAA